MGKRHWREVWEVVTSPGLLGSPVRAQDRSDPLQLLNLQASAQTRPALRSSHPICWGPWPEPLAGFSPEIAKAASRQPLRRHSLCQNRAGPREGCGLGPRPPYPGGGCPGLAPKAFQAGRRGPRHPARSGPIGRVATPSRPRATPQGRSLTVKDRHCPEPPSPHF